MTAPSQDLRIVHTADSASSYGTLGITGTTYQVCFDALSRILGSIDGAMALDFGAGPGRSSRFLRDIGATHVFAIDHSPEMIREGEAKNIPGVNYVFADGHIPLPDECVDVALSVAVFIEFTTLDAMLLSCKEVYRALRPGGRFVVANISPDAFTHKYVNFAYPPATGLESGATAMARIFTEQGVLELEDTYWTELDHRRTLAEAGFVVTNVEYPLGDLETFPHTDESTVGPFIIVTAVKPPVAS